MLDWADLIKDAKELPNERIGARGLFGEGCRYSEADGNFYVSDMTGCKVYKVPEAGPGSDKIELAFEVPEQPNGQAFHPDGSLIYSSMFDKKMMRRDMSTGRTTEYADLSPYMTGYNGDVVIDRHGRVYIDDVGSRVLHGEQPGLGRILIVDPDGKLRSGPEGLRFPNGCAIDTTGKNFIISESSGANLLTFDIDQDSGDLNNKQVLWDLREINPQTELNAVDGLCMDGEDGIWCSMLDRNCFVRRSKEGKITHIVKADGHCTACTLGGKDGKTLLMVTNHYSGGTIYQAMMDRRTSCTLSKTRVEIAKGAALP